MFKLNYNFFFCNTYPDSMTKKKLKIQKNKKNKILKHIFVF